MAHFSSIVSLILANLIPAAGVLFFKWDVLSIIFIYWLETVVIGCDTILKIVYVRGPFGKEFDHAPFYLTVVSRIASILFFIVHFGFFVFAQGFFVMRLAENFSNPSLWAIFLGLSSLFISHGISFQRNFIGKWEYTRINVGDLMFQPYKRVALMQFIVVIGTVVSLLTKNVSLGFVSALVVFKTGADLYAHLKEHGRFRQSDIMKQ